MDFNIHQTQLEDLNLASLPKEVQEQFFDFVNSVPLISWLIKKDRPRAKDLPRDDKGRIIVDVTHPHILENMDYFTETRRTFIETGKFTNLRPNPNPNSEYGKWIRREVDRIYNGMVRPEDGEWIPGRLYWFWNYGWMEVNKQVSNKKYIRVGGFPAVWDGHYLKYHYKEQARNAGLNGAELASRRKGKSYTMGSDLSYNFTWGESKEANRNIKSFVLSYSEEYLNKDGILNKFVSFLDFIRDHTEFPSMRLKQSWSDLHWRLGYVDLDTGTERGLKNEVIGVPVAASIDKVRGKRGSFIGIEEFGSFPNLLNMYQILLPSVRSSEDVVYGFLWLQGCVCAGTKVWTNDGRYINIEDLKVQDGVIGYDNIVIPNSIDTKLEPRPKPCLEIKIGEDNSLRCSIDHPILTAIKHTHRKPDNFDSRTVEYEYVFKRADQLKKGDFVVEARTIPVFGKETMEDPRLVGMLIGDGTYGYDQTPKFSSENEELLNYVKSKYEWSISASHITKRGNRYEDIRVKGITKELRRIGIFAKVKKAKRLPTNYQLLDYNNTTELLAGLFDTDGCIRKRDIVLTQSTKEILQEIKVLLRKLGITCSIQTQKARIQEGRLDKNDCYSIVIAGKRNIKLFAQHINLLVKEKREKLEASLCNYANVLSGKSCWYNRDKITLKRVSSIQDIGEQLTYNLSCSPTHTYLANNIVTHNTAGSKESDFASAQELMYNPKGYSLYAIENVYDKDGQGKKEFIYFFPAYMCREGFIDPNGNSDVTASLISILKERYRIKYNSLDPNALVSAIAEDPITPAEAIMKVKGSKFPVTQLTERLNQIDGNPTFYSDVYTGNLIFNAKGQVEFAIADDLPIRDFPLRDNKAKGCVEIYQMPEKKNGKVPSGRYIAGIDPIDNDESGTLSLVSCFILDLWEDTIVAEYTGRVDYADDCYEVVRRLLLFFNAIALYENNLKGLYTYFLKMNSLYLLADTPEYLKDKQIIKTIGIGNTSKGVNATAPVNNYADLLIRDWLLKPVPCFVKEKNELGEEELRETNMPNLYRLMGRALIKELIADDGVCNVDRVRALGMLMLLREGKIILYGGNKHQDTDEYDINNDPFFKENYDDRFQVKGLFDKEETY